MKRTIDFLDEHQTVTVLGRPGAQCLHVADGEPKPVTLMMGTGHHGTIQLGDEQADIEMVVKGETAHIRAFGRTFTLRIVDPVEQALQEAGGGSNRARAPMPGTVVEVQVTPGEAVSKGQPMMTIESMKILTAITAPRDGEIFQVHFEPGDTFEKNATLATLRQEEGE